MCVWMSNEREAGIERNIEQFVAVGGPGVGVLDAFDEMFVLGAGGGPQAESGVDVDPGLVRVSEGNQLGRAGVALEFALEGGRQHAAKGIGGQIDDVRTAEAEKSNGAIEGAVARIAGEDTDAGRPAKAFLFDVPA